MENRGNIRPSENNEADGQVDEPLDNNYSQEVEDVLYGQSESGETAPSRSARGQREIPAKTIKMKTDMMQFDFLSHVTKNLKERRDNEENDPDRHFLLSLLQDMKALSPYQKNEWKIILLTSLNRFKQEELATQPMPSTPPQNLPGPSSTAKPSSNSYNYPHYHQQNTHSVKKRPRASPYNLTELQPARISNQMSQSVGAARSLLYGASSGHYQPQGPESVLGELQPVVPFGNEASQTPGTSRTDSGATSPTPSVEDSEFDFISD